ncbi:flagellar hook protein FlgE [Hydrogenispora ethanolica]|jgi:flagellar hook protein FlgE|uniref:Flagellar hook protein FlgE n=1 Tax=Hydrogenispora ethanolica TaxID=1082276 RepID=A0A4R1RK44_HYDET|nr:flagellar hook protein FlgE [Hydrogenispora ethanolica]TCL66548.1 flagellar hook protein FlgE [Hydrogenispora ethanolica]
MMRSMYAGVSGLQNHQTRMDVIGNNIANVNTIGFKAGRVNFADTLSQMLSGASAAQGNRGGINAMQVGLGVGLASIDVLQTQGNLQSTGKLTDLALQGDGFFMLTDGSRTYYTRAGNFNKEEDGRLTNSANGFVVQGWLADSAGNINTNSSVVPIQLPMGQSIPASATTSIEFGGNLDSDTNGELKYPPITIDDGAGHTCTVQITLTAIGFNKFQYQMTATNGVVANGSGTITLDENGMVDSATPSPSTITVTPNGGTAVAIAVPDSTNTIPGGQFSYTVGGVTKTTDAVYTAPKSFVTPTDVYDSLGNKHVITTTAVKVADNVWNWTSTVDGGTTPIGNGTFTFDLRGNLLSATGGPLTFSPMGAAPVTITPDFSDISQQKLADSALTSPKQDGYPMGELQSFNIDRYGRIIGVFSNGLSQALAQVAVASFSNPEGLVRSGDTMFEESSNSGTAQVGTAGQGGRGKITPGATEMSNVDLSREFTEMIVTQRGFQANSKIITTSDEMLQDLVNLKR